MQTYHNQDISAIKEVVATQSQSLDLPYSSDIVELLIVVLMKKYLMFNGAHYHQVSGTAMGTKLGP